MRACGLTIIGICPSQGSLNHLIAAATKLQDWANKYEMNDGDHSLMQLLYTPKRSFVF